MPTTEEMVQQELFEAAISPEPSEESKAPAEPSTTEASPEAEQTTEQKASAEAEPSKSASSDQTEHIPAWRLREEAEARRQAEDRARVLEQRYNEAMAHWKQQQKGTEKPPSFYENPEAAIQAAIQQAIQPMQTQYHRTIQQLARGQAESVHGAEAVALAEKVFMQARDQRMLDPMDYERVVQAPNRFDACVQWYKNLYALHTVGNDPEAWWEKQFETKMADPKFQAAVMEKIKGSAASRPAEVKLPPSLSRSTAAASNGAGVVGDLSHESLWEHALK